MSFIDYYKILGIPPEASDEEIKEAYRRLVKLYHPDVNKEPEIVKRFLEVQKAYKSLIDPIKRKEYDDTNRKEFKKEFRSTSHTVPVQPSYVFPTFWINTSVVVDFGEMVHTLSPGV